MMNEKDMVNDILSQTKKSMGDYTNAIGCTSNQALRGAYQQLRDEAEQFQVQLGNIAQQKGYYTAPKTTNQQERQQLKSQLNQSMNQTQGGNTTGMGRRS
ncbi:MAG: spore coat protein [Firmicutes bacterium]|nr:spore coat protein [Bacillota bacterium]